MAKENIDVLIEGGKATAAPPLGPALGPMGVNIGQVVAEINKKTESFKGMQVPVTVTIDSDTKEFTISVGTPPASALIKEAAGIKKGAANPKTEKVADLKIQQIMKIAKMKEDVLLGKTLKEKTREIIGTCQSMGILVEGVEAQEALKQVKEGKFDELIKSGKTELTEEEKKEQEEEKIRLEEDMKERREEYLEKANAIVNEMKGKDVKTIEKRLKEEEIPAPIITEVLPKEEEKKEGEGEEKKEEVKEEKK